MVVVGGLALLGEVAVRLDAVLEAVQLCPALRQYFVLRHPCCVPALQMSRISMS